MAVTVVGLRVLWMAALSRVIAAHGKASKRVFAQIYAVAMEVRVLWSPTTCCSVMSCAVLRCDVMYCASPCCKMFSYNR